MRDGSLLADARTPESRTVWNFGGGTDAASRLRSESGSMSTATVLVGPPKSLLSRGCPRSVCDRGAIAQKR